MPKLTNSYQLINGDSLQELKKIPDSSVDSIVTDPPYPYIKRSYGFWTEDEWFKLMDSLIIEARRILKPKGSAIFILQPNHETPGKVRPWLFRFMLKYIEEWNMPQDIWWFNTTAMPTTHCSREYGLMRPSVKACVWLGPVDCYKNQEAILWTSSLFNKYNDLEDRALKKSSSGGNMRRGKCIQTSIDRGGSTPFNIFPIGSGSKKRRGSKHGATTPLELCEQLVKYITPPNGLVLDPFSGVGTVGLAALKNGFNYVGIEKEKPYHDEARLIFDEFEKEQNIQLTLFED